MSRRATIRTTHDDPALVARALAPDNTDEMETAVDGDDGGDTETAGAVVTRIERETTGGLHSNVDDYVVNLEVAMDVAAAARNAGGADEQHEQPADAGLAFDANADTDTPNTQ
ncbi:KEOPS complex subunit Pcc1 [Haloterrigena alkaliphila]|uniref:KEOPS complex Pcc1-like subunit n=1 Tax=Haloterrigena alkaliphila TaxID=2816475 RepID=A0A8A2V8Z6_9EURY|nr:KEOPS complex subunit Pcc1 [Haloterrigena alkaliphila]QSW98479.1 KEOPS complex Pcc1-like subunit [Haloterrigena alkaliphila]